MPNDNNHINVIMSRDMSALVRAAVSLALLATAVAKFVGGHDPRVYLPALLYYSAAAVELVLAIMLWSRYGRQAALLGLVFFTFAFLSAVLFPTMSCGCLGPRVILDRPTRMAISAVLGYCCTYLLMVSSESEAVSDTSEAVSDTHVTG
jgi:hypothetical protein